MAPMIRGSHVQASKKLCNLIYLSKKHFTIFSFAFGILAATNSIFRLMNLTLYIYLNRNSFKVADKILKMTSVIDLDAYGCKLS